MLDKGTIITTAFNNVGDTILINDNRNDKWEKAGALLLGVVRSLNISRKLIYNSKTIKLQTTGRLSALGETEYITPNDYLVMMGVDKPRTQYNTGVISLAEELHKERKVSYRVEDGFIYSFEPNLVMQYKARTALENFPDYMFDYVAWLLTLELIGAFPEYKSYAEMAVWQITQTLKSVVASEPRGFIGGER